MKEEESSKACLSTALTVGLHLGRTAMAILDAGTDEQKEKYLPPMAEGSCLGAYAFTEPDAGSDLSHLQTVAVPDGEGYVVTGTKSWVSNAGIAGLFLVFAATDPKKGKDGISAFIVPKDTSGLFVGYREPTLGLRGLDMHTVYFDECRVSAAARLGEEGAAWAIGQKAEARTKLVIAAAALGASEAVLTSGINFSIERKQFGGPIANKQAIQNFVADTAIEIEALRHHDPVHGLAGRPRAGLRQGRGDDQSPGRSRRQRRGQPHGADARRLWLYGRLAGGPFLPRRARAANPRRHRRGAALFGCARGLQAGGLSIGVRTWTSPSPRNTLPSAA